MTLPKRSLHPTSGDNRRAILRALEFFSRVGMQFTQIRQTVIGQRVPLEPCPQILDRIHVGRVGWQECQLDMTVQPVQILAHQFAAMRSQSVQDNQQWLLEMRFERLQEFDDLFFLDAPFVQTEQTVGARQPGNDRDVK